MQADTVAEVAAFAAREAARRFGRGVLVEDAGLFVDALKGFPGPFSSYVFKTIGISGLLGLIGEGTVSPSGRTARFKSAVAFCEPGGEPHLFNGEVQGTITVSPRGTNGFGFDPVFLPTGAARTMGELTLEEKCAVSHRGEALRSFAAWFLGSRPAGQRF